MSDINQPTYQGIYLSGNFEIEEQTSADNGWRSEYRTYVILIGCGGADREQRLLYEIQAKGYSGAQFKLLPNHIYYLRGAFYPSNTQETTGDQLIFEGSDISLIGPSEDFDGDLVDSVGVTGLGIVTDIRTMVEACCQHMKKSPDQANLLTTVFTVQHSDYNPVKKTPCMSKVEYRVRPTPNLAKIAGIVQKGRECQFHGFVKDFNEETNCYIVIANKVHITSGFQDLSTVSQGKNDDSGATPNKPKKFKPKALNSEFKSPLTGGDFVASAAFGATDQGSAKMGICSSLSTDTLKASGSSSNITTPDALSKKPKKRARSQPKRKNGKEAEMDMDYQE